MNTTYHKKECTEVTHSEESIPNLKKKMKKKNCKKKSKQRCQPMKISLIKLKNSWRRKQ